MRILSNSKLFVMTFMTLGLVATQAKAANTFTLEQAKDMAVNGGAQTLVQANLQIKATAGDEAAARALRLPSFTASVSANHETLLGTGSGTYVGHSIDATIPLFNRSITTAIDSATHLNLSAQQMYNATMILVVEQVAFDYYNVVKANKDIESAQDILDLSNDYYAKVYTKKQNGQGDAYTVAYAAAQVNTAQGALEQAKLEKRQSCGILLTLINDVDGDQMPNFDDCDHVVDPVLPNQFSVDVKTAISRAKMNRPEIPANQENVRALQAQANGIGGILNDITVSAGIANTTPGRVPGSPNVFGSGLDPFHPGNTNAAGINISGTFGFDQSHRKDAALDRVGIAESGVNAATQSVEADVINAAAALDAAYAQRTINQNKYNNATTALAALQVAVDAGTIPRDATTYVTNLQTVAAAEQAKNQSDSVVAQALAQLQAATASPSRETLTQFVGSGLIDRQAANSPQKDSIMVRK